MGFIRFGRWINLFYLPATHKMNEESEMDEKITQEPLTKSNKTKYRLAKSMKKCMQSSSVESITVKQIAGMGFSNVGLGIAHSMAHTLGAVYDTPHGVACAMMLPIVMEYNQECTGEKYREIARAMGVKGVDEMSQDEYRKAAIEAVKKLSVDVGIPTKLEAIKEEDLQFLAESAHADACAPGNPKDASVEDLKDLFRKIM